jgi:hypothetical protein
MLQMSRWAALVAAPLAFACAPDEITSVAEMRTPAAQVQLNGFAAPSGIVTISSGDVEAAVWPYTSTAFSTTPQDPINLVFMGAADPREIRSVLLGLSGSGRPGPLAAFNCTWSDAVGNPQTGYAASEGWVGSTIQLQCGNFQGPRFHIRMFRQGDVTLANAHYEILIPGTNLHEVLSWELAEALVTADLARSGFLAAAPALTAVVTAAPYFRTVQAPVAAMLPAPQKAALGLLTNGDGTASIPNDGRATMFVLAAAPALATGLVESEFVIQFGQVIPKPFCVAGTTGYLYATGPITVRMTSGVVGRNFQSSTTSTGTLNLIEFNPLNGQTLGSPYQGVIHERTTVNLTDGSSSVEFFSTREETPDGGPTRGIRVEQLRVRQNGEDAYDLSVSC